MKKTKKIYLSIFILITLVFMPLASSVTIKNRGEHIYDVDKESTCGGILYGYTGDHLDTWGSLPVPFALVDAGVKKTISGYPMGYYKITGLPFNQEITIIASKKGYHSDTLKRTFTEKDPIYYYCFDLKEDGDSVKEKVSNNDIGRIYGYTVSSHGWSWNPISTVLVTTGLQGKSTLSDGHYSISGLPLNIPIIITARKLGYYSDSKTVTLTGDDPEEYIILDIQPITIESKAKNAELVKDLFSLISLGSDTWSYFFCTLSFVT